MKLKLIGAEERYSFIGAYNHHVELYLFPEKVEQAGHIVVLPIYNNQMVFTRHKERGLEWPGGKVEKGETPLEAAIRELKEETGATSKSIWLVGQYLVQARAETFRKNIYVAEVESIQTWTGEDTEGAVLLPLYTTPDHGHDFSPLVTDPVFEYVRCAILEQALNT